MVNVPSDRFTHIDKLPHDRFIHITKLTFFDSSVCHPNVGESSSGEILFSTIV